jgi:hypothetical protein
MKNSSDTIGNRTCDLPACSAVPQPTAPPRARRQQVEVIRKSPDGHLGKVGQGEAQQRR